LKIRTYIVFIFLFINCQSQSNSKLLEVIINHNPILKNVIDKASTYKPQIIYTQINRDANNNPSFINHTYLLDSSNYFYCASLVKLPCSIFALEKINELNIRDLNKDSYMFTDNIYPCQTSCIKDTSSESGYPSLSHYIKKMLLVSDNFSYSRVYEFLNPKYIQKKLTHYGYPNARIIHRFDPACKGEANSMNPIRFFDTKMNLVYKQEADLKNQPFENPLGKIVLGEDVYNKKGKLISEKKDFTYSNYLPLANIHSILQRLLFQNHLSEKQKFNITQNDWQFLVKLVGMYPRETDYPRYNSKTFHDSFKKYFMYGNKVKQIDSDSLRVFNVIGYSYGFLVDVAYIVNYKTKTEFMLSSVLYTNSRNSFGSGSYEYESIGIPFLKELSTELYSFEQKRKKANLPDLTEFDLYKKKDDTTKLSKVIVNGIITVNGRPSAGNVIVKSINKHFSYYPEAISDKANGVFSLKLLAGEEYEMEFTVEDAPPQIIEIDTKKNKANDTVNVFVDFMSAHLDKIIKTKQDSLFLTMLRAYNKISLKKFADKYGSTKVEGLTYKVQIGAYKFIENFNYNSVAGMPIIIRETFDDYITRFTMGNYSTFNEANDLLKRLKEKNLKDAFIFAVYNKKRLYLNELLESEIIK